MSDGRTRRYGGKLRPHTTHEDEASSGLMWCTNHRHKDKDRTHTLPQLARGTHLHHEDDGATTRPPRRRCWPCLPSRTADPISAVASTHKPWQWQRQLQQLLSPAIMAMAVDTITAPSSSPSSSCSSVCISVMFIIVVILLAVVVVVVVIDMPIQHATRLCLLQQQ